MGGPFEPRTFAADEPNRLAVKMCSTGEAVTFGELDARANQGAHLIRHLGIKGGEHIAVLMENRREFLEICFAADRTGIYYTTISTHLTGEEVEYTIRDCSARLLIVSDSFARLAKTLETSLQSTCTVMIVGEAEHGLEG